MSFIKLSLSLMKSFHKHTQSHFMTHLTVSFLSLFILCVFLFLCTHTHTHTHPLTHLYLSLQTSLFSGWSNTPGLRGVPENRHAPNRTGHAHLSYTHSLSDQPPKLFSPQPSPLHLPLLTLVLNLLPSTLIPRFCFLSIDRSLKLSDTKPKSADRHI